VEVPSHGGPGETANEPDANNSDTCGSTGCPQAPYGVPPGKCYRFRKVVPPLWTAVARGLVRFDPAAGHRVPLGGRTGVDRCRMSTGDPAGGRCQPKQASCRLTRSVTNQSPPIPDTGEQTREQAYVPAEQPPPSQDARFPSADAYPRRTRHSGVAPPQGPQPPGCLSAVPRALTSRLPRRGAPC